MNDCTEPVKILCVDDERNILQALERSFLDDNYEIVSATSAAEGLQALEESGPFQVVISDYRMPVMNGVDFLKEVYARWPDTIRLVLSGYADVGAIVAAINEGHIYKFIPKPWDDEDLRLTIQKSLEHYALQKKNRELREQLDAANRSLEFSQSLLGTLPVGVAAIDEHDMITYANERAVKLLTTAASGIAGENVAVCCGAALGGLVEQVRRENSISIEIELPGGQCRVLGRDRAGTITLVFLGAGA